MPKKSEEKWGTPIYLQLAIIKMESDFDWLAKPPRQNFLKLFHIKDHLALLVIRKLLMEHGNNIKKKQEISLQLELDLKIVLILLVGIRLKTEKILKVSKTDAFKQYIAYHEGWGNYKNYKSNKKVINFSKESRKNSQIFIKNNYLTVRILYLLINILFF